MFLSYSPPGTMSKVVFAQLMNAETVSFVCFFMAALVAYRSSQTRSSRCGAVVNESD